MGDLGSDSSTPPAKSESLFLQIVERLDGTISRPFIPLIPTTEGDPATACVRSRDISLNPSTKTSLRLFLPLPPSSPEKLPIVLFIHGGGFILFSSASAPYHYCCEQMARSLPALILSLDYRLSPEHRLPSAYSDAVDAILWLRSQAAADPKTRDPWIAANADLNRFFLAGSSSGANIAFHAALIVADLDINPLRIAGVVLNQPYLGGEDRTPSETASEEDMILPLRASDMMWRLSLPSGANRDHEYCNPAMSMAAERIAAMPARCLVKGRKGDPLIDRQRGFVRAMEAAGVSLTAQLEDEGLHAMEIFDSAAAEALFADFRGFMSE